MTDVKPEADTILAAGVRLHGFPYDIHAYAEVAPVLAAAGCRVIVPDSPTARQPDSPANEHRLWYQYYFHSERGGL
jgi:hypothetical protein